MLLEEIKRIITQIKKFNCITKSINMNEINLEGIKNEKSV